jgi:hypothetical protein
MAVVLLPNGMQQFIDGDGVPLAGGWVYFYEPNTSPPEFKDTWSDIDQTGTNTNPIELDADGRATIWGSGIYRQVLQDSLHNEIWDKITSTGTAAELSNFIYPPVFIEGKPADGEVYPVFNNPGGITIVIPADLVNSIFSVEINPTSDSIFTITVNNVIRGTVTFNSAGVATVSFPSAVTMLAGDQLRLISPSPQDATLEGFAGTFVFTVD